MEILVAGAGIVGVSSAIWLQRAGHRVTLVDRQAPGGGTSYGNAGVLAAGSIVPVTTPSLWKSAPRMLFDPASPLFLRWGYLPRLLPFLAKYMGHANDAHVRRYARAMHGLLHDTVDQHSALAAGTEAEHYITREDYCFGYATRAAYQGDAYAWTKRDAEGVKYEVLRGHEYAARDGIWGDAFDTVVACKEHGRISDPGAYVKALANHFVAEGGTLHIAPIDDITLEDGEITALNTPDGPLTADKIVFALGPWSKEIARKLGVKVPFESERGYHIELVAPSRMSINPMMVASGKFVITPMNGRLRAAGVIEFGGLDAGPSAAPFDLLKRQVAAVLPDITYSRIDEWMGHRPAPADSLPLIGANSDAQKSYSAFGHQHVGLTGGAKTGRLIADLVSGRQPNIDMAPFDPQKYK
jgi:D-amino-acid dehydrogenase